jgi:2-(1,2-epoxy-1,2-dihydrophenyl)acetyl-CoA isomerase
MIWACVDDQALKAEAMSLARTLSTLPAHGALETRLAYAASDSNTLTEQLRYEKLRQGELANRDTLSEGIVAFLQKRDPVFSGR